MLQKAGHRADCPKSRHLASSNGCRPVLLRETTLLEGSFLLFLNFVEKNSSDSFRNLNGVRRAFGWLEFMAHLLE